MHRERGRDSSEGHEKPLPLDRELTARALTDCLSCSPPSVSTIHRSPHSAPLGPASSAPTPRTPRHAAKTRGNPPAVATTAHGHLLPKRSPLDRETIDEELEEVVILDRLLKRYQLPSTTKHRSGQSTSETTRRQLQHRHTTRRDLIQGRGSCHV